MTNPGPVPTVSRADKLNHIGSQLFSEGQLDPARVHFLAALALDGRHSSALSNLGACLRNSGFYAASEIVAQRSVVLEPNNPWFRSNLGVSLMGMKRYTESLAELKASLDLMPDAAPSWHNYGIVLYIVGRHEEALRALDKSLSLSTSVQALSDKSLALLSLGRIQEGLETYEIRWNILKKNRIWTLNIPEWRGESLDGRRILIHHEQGFGDSLMLVRFVKALAKWHCQITIAVPESLQRLFQRSFPFTKVISVEDEALNDSTDFDYHSPMLSLMRHVGVAKPRDISQEPYLTAKPEPVMRLPDTPVKIGICWASGDHSPVLRDRRRLVPITQFLPLLENPRIALISLQKGGDTKDLVNNGLEGLVFDVSMKLEDFAYTANTIASLDFVISVDSAVAHLAGALGKPCLMLSPYSRCWRWWSKDTGWPWYNRMKIFHQESSGSWSEPMKQVVKSALWMAKQDI